ncbi:MAG: chromosomal replication initiator protein DnaA [Clostridia bacterium]|nr:chromosomal replication initiator protein DnaA [Clostridia bacterium]
MESLNEMWTLVCNELRQSLNDVIFNIWFSPSQIIDFDGATVRISASEFRKTTIEKKFYKELSDAFRNVLGFDVNIVIDDSEKPEQTVQVQETAVPDEQPVTTTEENTFETFVVGNDNRFAYTAAKAVAENPGKGYNPLFIYGSSGLGKTHLLCAIRNEILADNPDMNVIFTRGEDLVNLIVHGINSNNMNSIHEKLRNCDVLLVDDIQFIAGKNSTQEEFFHTFNALEAEKKQIVLISDSTPKDIPVLDERLRTRFEQGLIADIQPPDFETRMAIIQRKANNLEIELPQEVAEFIAEKVKTNIRQLEGAVKKIHALVNLEGTPINIAMAQNAIKDLASEGLPTDELVNRIISETARTFGIPQTDIVSKKKDNKTVKARQVAIYAIREAADLTQQEISEYFSGRDRTTIHYALNKIQPMIERDPAMRRNVENIIKNAKEQ